MLCVTGVYLRDITNTIFFSFAFECESERFLVLYLFVLVVLTDCIITHFIAANVKASSVSGHNTCSVSLKKKSQVRISFGSKLKPDDYKP